MKIINLSPCGMFGVNSYIIYENKSAALVDAAGNTEEIMTVLRENDLRLEKILLTHGHCDHILGLSEIVEKTGADTFIHEADEKKLGDNELNLTEYFSLPPIKPVSGNIRTLKDGDTISLDNAEIKVMHTPGHTSGSVMYIVGDNIFSGDTLFKGSIGRTDMPDGSSSVMIKTLSAIAHYDWKYPDYTIYPGHSGITGLRAEMQSNPYLLSYGNN